MANEREVRIVVTAADQASGKLQSLGGQVGGIFSGMLATAGGFIAADIFGRVTKGVGNMVRGMVEGNAEFERYETQFGVLLGSSEAAKERLEELAEFGQRTPFELPDVVQASRLLQTFGGDALATGDSLELVGDMAAASGAQFNEIAMWVGRAYTAIESGRPFGEAAARLQELGLMSGEMRQQLEDMTAEGASSTEVWDFFTSQMGENFGGMMEQQSQTFEGMMSNLVDWKDNMLRELGAPIFEQAKEGMATLLEFLESPEAQAALDNVGVLIGNIAGAVSTLMEALMSGDIDLGALIPEWLADGLPAIAEAFQNLGAAFVESGPAMQEQGAMLADTFQRMMDAIGPAVIANATLAINTFAEMWRTQGPGIISAVGAIVGGIGTLLAGMVALTSGIVAALVAILNEDFMGAWEAILTGIDGVLRTVGTDLDSFVTVWRNNWEMAKTIVFAIWDGIKSGVMGKINALKDSIIGGLQDLWDAATSFLDMGSPSKLWAEAGAAMMEGVGLGAEREKESAQGPLLDALAPPTGGRARGGRGGGGGLQLVLVYQPGISLADENELENRLMPLVARLQRRAELRGL